MRAAIVVGSARENGNTDTQCSALAESLSEEGFEVEIIKPYSLEISHCKGCNKCIDSSECVINDDMELIYDSYDEADLFIIATPVYFSAPSSIIMQVIDRFQCKWEPIESPKTGKKVALIASGGSRNPRFENLISICRAFAITVRAEYIGECLYENTDDSDTSNLSSSAYRFGKDIALKFQK